MTTKMHMTPDGPRECGATKRKCKYADMTTTSTANDRIADLQKKLSPNKNLPPIDVPDNALKEPLVFSYFTYVDVDYDTYSDDNDDYGYGGEEYYSHSAPYINKTDVRITAIDIRGVLSEFYQCNKKDVPDDKVAYAESEGWDRPEKWEVRAEGDYYEDAIVVEPPSDMKDKLTQDYWKYPNAVDYAGILKYCRGKGFDTTGKSPIEAIKEQLDNENLGTKSAKVNKATKVSMDNVKFDKVQISQTNHYNKIQPKKAKSPFKKGGLTVHGVVFKESGKNHLVDGFHRTKDSIQSGKKSGKYIILEA
jgi:hypothetical protein